MNFDTFFNKVEKSDIHLDFSEHEVSHESNTVGMLDNEALFQLPFISLVVLLLAKDRSKPKVEEIGRLVGESLEVAMPAFKKSRQKIGWSANLRIRTINAMTFLEGSSLILVNNRKGRLEITDKGKKIISSALKLESNLSYNLMQISKAYRNICVSRRLELELK